MSEVDVINSRKQDIVNCITNSIVDNSNLDFESVFELVNERVNNANIIVPLLNDFESSYDVKLNQLMKEVSELVFFDVSLVLTNKAKFVKSSNLNKECDEFITNMYEKNVKMYENIGISLDKFIELYSFYKIDGIKKVNSKIKKLVKMASFYDFKRDFSFLIDALNYKKSIRGLDSLFDRFDVKTIEEFIEFRNEVLSFTLDEKKYPMEEKKIILENRESFKKRNNKIISNQEAKKMLKKIDEIFNLSAFKAVFSEECWKSMIEKVGLSSTNICNVTSVYTTLMSSSAMCSKYFDKNKESIVYCMFPKKIFSLFPKTINNIIIHEFIHSVDGNNPNISKSFSKKYSLINEAITEYFSNYAIKYLNKDIFDGDDKKKESASIYDSMLSLVEILKNSGIWNDILLAKINDDVVELENKVGYFTMSKIKECFSNNFLSMQNYSDKRLMKILQNKEKKVMA